ncbi:MAG: hypothetical protein ACK4MX_05665 [Thermaurantiacus sp.]
MDAAAFHVERSVASANAARAADPMFAAQWDRLLDQRVLALADSMLERALHGVAEPIVGDNSSKERRIRYNDTLGMFLLRKLMPEVYGPQPRPAAALRRSASAAGEPADPDGLLDEAAEAHRMLAELSARMDAEAAGQGVGATPPVRPKPGCPDRA